MAVKHLASHRNRGSEDLGGSFQLTSQKPHLLLPWGWSGHLRSEGAVGSSSLAGPSPSQATQSARVSASGASGCERNPGRSQQRGRAVSGQGVSCLPTPTKPTEVRLTSEKCPKAVGKASLLCSRCRPLPSQAAHRS